MKVIMPTGTKIEISHTVDIPTFNACDFYGNIKNPIRRRAEACIVYAAKNTELFVVDAIGDDGSYSPACIV